MFLALAALLIQPQVIRQNSFSAEKIAVIEPLSSALSSVSLTEMLMAPPAAEGTVPLSANSDAVALPDAPGAASVTTPAAISFMKPLKATTVSVEELRANGRRNQRIWMGLGIASHSAATFDAWSTRHAITTHGAQELNPMFRPFAGNASLYAAIQVGPVLMDYVGKKMMYSKHAWVRRMWWVPQTASFASSLFCGARNLTAR